MLGSNDKNDDDDDDDLFYADTSWIANPGVLYSSGRKQPPLEKPNPISLFCLLVTADFTSRFRMKYAFAKVASDSTLLP